MTVVFERVESLDSFVEFDQMFAAAESRLDANFFSQVPMTLSFDDKKLYYKDQIKSAYDRTWPLLQTEESVFFYKGTYDGTLMEFAGGFIEADGITLRVNWYLTAPDAMDSRNSIHTAETAAIRKAFYAEHGLSRYRIMTFVGSSFYQWIKLRINSGAITLISETESPGHTSEINFVTFYLEA
jgi:hypothetical protein